MNDFTYTVTLASIQLKTTCFVLILEKETVMTYIFLATFGAIILGLIILGSWEGEGRMINADWLDSEEKFHLISRWGA
jgi:hypothetical protein